ncbi:MAG: hypothetical protein WCO55_01660 [Candidatus Falkowbacteria bacterium]
MRQVAGFSEDIFEKPNRPSKLSNLINDVNTFLASHPDASLQWLQSSASSGNRDATFTTLTAIITYTK